MRTGVWAGRVGTPAFSNPRMILKVGIDSNTDDPENRGRGSSFRLREYSSVKFLPMVRLPESDGIGPCWEATRATGSAAGTAGAAQNVAPKKPPAAAILAEKKR